MKKEYNIAVRKNRSNIGKITLWIRQFGNAFEERAEMKRNQEIFNYNNRWRDYRKF